MTSLTAASRGGWHRLAPAIVWATLGAAVAYVLAVDPADRVADPTGACTWHTLFGVDGPSCGGTRMVWYLLHGDLVQAARHHLAALIAVPFVLYALVRWTAAGFGVPLPWRHPPGWVFITCTAFFLVYAAVLRNLAWAPFTWFYVENLT